MENNQTYFEKSIKLLTESSFSGSYEESTQNLKFIHGIQGFCFNMLIEKNQLNEYKLVNCMRKVRDTMFITGELYSNLTKL